MKKRKPGTKMPKRIDEGQCGMVGLSQRRRPPIVRKKPSRNDELRLARLDRIDALYADRLAKLRGKLDQLMAEHAARKAPIIAKIRPEFRPAE